MVHGSSTSAKSAEVSHFARPRGLSKFYAKSQSFPNIQLAMELGESSRSLAKQLFVRSMGHLAPYEDKYSATLPYQSSISSSCAASQDYTSSSVTLNPQGLLPSNPSLLASSRVADICSDFIAALHIRDPAGLQERSRSKLVRFHQ